MSGDLPDRLPIARYMFLAEWYRSWAQIAGNDTVRQQRLALAELMECLVQQMNDTNPKNSD